MKSSISSSPWLGRGPSEFRKRRPHVLALVLAVLLVLLIVAPYVASEWLRNSETDQVNRLRELEQSATEVAQRNGVIDGNLKGFLLGGVPDFLVDFPGMAAIQRGSIAQLSKLGASAFPVESRRRVPAPQGVLSVFEQTALKWLNDYAEQIYRHARAGATVRQLRGMRREGDILTRDINTDAESLHAAIERERSALTARVERLRRWTLIITLILGLIAILASFALFVMARSAAELYGHALEAYRRTQKTSDDLSSQVSLLKALLRHSPFSIALLEQGSLSVVLTNEAFERLPFLRRDVTIVRDIRLPDLINESEAAERFLAAIQRSIETRSVVVEPAVQLHAGAQSGVWSLRSVPFTGVAERPLLLLIWEDITPEHRAHERFAQEHAKARQLASEVAVIVDTMDDGVALVGENGEIHVINARARKLLSIPEGVPAPLPASSFPVELRQAIEILIGARRERKRVLYFMSAAGESAEAVVTAVSREGAQRPSVVIVVRDVSEIRKAVREKDEFLALASHELKTPVTVLDAALQLFENAYREHNEPVALKLLAQLRTQSRRLRLLVSQLFDYANIQTGKLKLSVEKLDLAARVQEWSEELRAIAAPHRIIVRKPARPVWVIGEPGKLYQVLSNLVANAIRYSEKPGEIEIDVSEQEGMGRVCVVDQGIGIAPADLLKLFQRYAHAEGVVERKAGLGIGLFVAAEIIRAHGGRIWAESGGLGKGSQFQFELPAVQAGIGEQRESAA